MSSTADSLKQAANEAPADEPSQKKVKIQDELQKASICTTANKSDTAEGGGGGGTTTTTTTANNNNNNNNNNASSDVKKSIPTKAANGDVAPAKQHDEELGEEDDVDDDDDELDSLEMGAYDPKISDKLEQVGQIQSEICNLNEKASEEILKVEQKFNKLRRPHFEKRNEILKEIPNFWLTSMANHPMIAPMIESGEDEDCLHYMVNLDVEEFEDIKSGYKLKLHFVDNPYIANETITKEFQVLSSEDANALSSLEKPIEYKNTPQGQKLKQLVEASIASSRRSRVPTHQVHHQVQPQSFFAWLTESSTDEIAEILKDQIWPNPLEFFFATPDTYEVEDDESDDDDEEIDDEDLDDDEDGDGDEADEHDLENLEVEYDEELEDDDVEDYEEDEEAE